MSNFEVREGTCLNKVTVRNLNNAVIEQGEGAVILCWKHKD